mmetsp:Transcript_33846/g.97312  ORF Transcript_33846/g.97312 Transcript_33846/m.97312 type:complete len:222 (+) Transcript_33846:559-1224(+)
MIFITVGEALHASSSESSLCRFVSARFGCGHFKISVSNAVAAAQLMPSFGFGGCRRLASASSNNGKRDCSTWDGGTAPLPAEHGPLEGVETSAEPDESFLNVTSSKYCWTPSLTASAFLAWKLTIPLSSLVSSTLPQIMWCPIMGRDRRLTRLRRRRHSLRTRQRHPVTQPAGDLPPGGREPASGAVNPLAVPGLERTTYGGAATLRRARPTAARWAPQQK